MAEIDTGTQEFRDAVTAAADEKNAGLKSAFDKEKASGKAAKADLAKFEGIDPDKYRTLVTDAETAEAKRQKSIGDWEARESKLQEGFDAQIKKMIGERDAAITQRDAGTTELDSYLREKAAIEVIAPIGSVKLLLPEVLKLTKLVEVDGKKVVQVLDANGAPRLRDGAKTATDFMGISELVESFREDDELARAFNGTGSTGSGAQREAIGSQGSDAVKHAARLKAEGVVVYTAGDN